MELMSSLEPRNMMYNFIGMLLASDSHRTFSCFKFFNIIKFSLDNSFPTIIKKLKNYY